MIIPLSQILNIERTLFLPIVSSKKKAFDVIAEAFALSDPQLKQSEVFDSLITRERLGSTAIDSGVAFPHGRLINLNNPMACFMLLKDGIDFDTIDNIPIDIIFALIVPMEAHQHHLEILSEIAKLLNQDFVLQAIRQSPNRESLYQLIIQG